MRNGIAMRFQEQQAVAGSGTLAGSRGRLGEPGRTKVGEQRAFAFPGGGKGSDIPGQRCLWEEDRRLVSRVLVGPNTGPQALGQDGWRGQRSGPSPPHIRQIWQVMPLWQVPEARDLGDAQQMLRSIDIKLPSPPPEAADQDD